MAESQKRAVESYRNRLAERGLVRFEVLGPSHDRDLIRTLARCLAKDDAEAARLRATMRAAIAGEPPRKGGVLAALRRSPLVGANLDLMRPTVEGRTVDL